MRALQSSEKSLARRDPLVNPFVRKLQEAFPSFLGQPWVQGQVSQGRLGPPDRLKPLLTLHSSNYPIRSTSYPVPLCYPIQYSYAVYPILAAVLRPTLHPTLHPKLTGRQQPIRGTIPLKKSSTL